MEKYKLPYKQKCTLRKQWRRACYSLRIFLTEHLLPPIGQIIGAVIFALGLLLFLVAGILFSLFYPLVVFKEIYGLIYECCGYCSVHKVKFQSELIYVSEEEAYVNRSITHGVRYTLTNEYLKVKTTEFPNANDERPVITEAGTQQRRYCSVCRARKQYHRERGTGTIQPRVRDFEYTPEQEASALRELEELERNLGLSQATPVPVSDETMGNQEAKAGDL